MSNRKNILTDLRSWLEGITAANGYRTTVAEVRRGIHLPEDMRARPALCFWNDRAPSRDLAGEQRERTLHLWIWGYSDAPAGDFGALDDLAADVETCLNGSRENWDESIVELSIRDLSFYEGGASDPVGIFEMEVELTYQYDRATP